MPISCGERGLLGAPQYSAPRLGGAVSWEDRRENDPECEVQAAHEVLEDVACESEKYQRVVARDLITLEEMQAHAADLNGR